MTKSPQTNRLPGMFRRVLIGAALGAAVALAVHLSASGHGTLRLGPLSLSGDWLKKLSPYLPAWPVTICGGALLGIGVGLVREMAWRRRTAAMDAAAAALGFSHAPELDVGARKELAWLFGGSTKFAHHFRGAWDGVVMEIVDVAANAVSQIDLLFWRWRTSRTVFLTTLAGCPDFVLRPRSSIHRFLTFLGFGGMTFDARGIASPRLMEAVDRFRDHWDLQPVHAMNAWHLPAAELESRENNIRALFVPGLMETLEEFRGWSLEMKEGRLLAWPGTGRVPAAERGRLASTALRIHRSVANRSEVSESDPLPPQPGDSWALKKRRMAGAVVGAAAIACLGFVAGFLLFVRVFFWGREGVGWPAQALAFFLCPLAGTALGALAGSMVGSRLAGFIKPAPPAPQSTLR